MLAVETSSLLFSLLTIANANEVPVHLPPALGQHPMSFFDVVTRLGFALIIGVVMYIGTLCSLWLFTFMFLPRPFRTLNKAALVFGLSFALLLPAMWSELIAPGNLGGSIEVGLMATIVLTGSIIGIRIVVRG